MELTSQQISARNLIQKHLGVSRAYATEIFAELARERGQSAEDKRPPVEEELLAAHAGFVERGLDAEFAMFLEGAIDRVRSERRGAAAAHAASAVASSAPAPEFSEPAAGEIAKTDAPSPQPSPDGRGGEWGGGDATTSTASDPPTATDGAGVFPGNDEQPGGGAGDDAGPPIGAAANAGTAPPSIADPELPA